MLPLSENSPHIPLVPVMKRASHLPASRRRALCLGLALCLSFCLLLAPACARAYTNADLAGTWYEPWGGFGAGTDKLVISADGTSVDYETVREDAPYCRHSYVVSGDRVVFTVTWTGDDPDADPVGTVYSGTVTSLTADEMCVLFDGSLAEECWQAADPRPASVVQPFDTGIDWTRWQRVYGVQSNFTNVGGTLRIKALNEENNSAYTGNLILAQESRGFDQLTLNMALISISDGLHFSINSDCILDSEGKRWTAQLGIQKTSTSDDIYTTVTLHHANTGTEISLGGQHPLALGEYHDYSLALDRDAGAVQFLLDGRVIVTYPLPAGAVFLPTEPEYSGQDLYRYDWYIYMHPGRSEQEGATPSAELSIDSLRFDWDAQVPGAASPAINLLLLTAP